MGKRIDHASRMKLVRAAEGLRQEADPKAAAMGKALKDLRRLRDEVGGRNKVAKLLGVTGPYIGRVLSGENPVTEKLAKWLRRSAAEGERIAAFHGGTSNSATTILASDLSGVDRNSHSWVAT